MLELAPQSGWPSLASSVEAKREGARHDPGRIALDHRRAMAGTQLCRLPRIPTEPVKRRPGSYLTPRAAAVAAASLKLGQRDCDDREEVGKTQSTGNRQPQRLRATAGHPWARPLRSRRPRITFSRDTPSRPYTGVAVDPGRALLGRKPGNFPRKRVNVDTRRLRIHGNGAEADLDQTLCGRPAG